MKTKFLLLINLLMVLMVISVNSQEKYAIILTGDPSPEAESIVPPEQRWPQAGESTNEFWHDTFLIAEYN